MNKVLDAVQNDPVASAIVALLALNSHPNTLEMLSQELMRLPDQSNSYLWTNLLIAHLHKLLQDTKQPTNTIEMALKVLNQAFQRCSIQELQTQQSQFVPFIQTFVNDTSNDSIERNLTEEGRCIALECLNQLCFQGKPQEWLASHSYLNLVSFTIAVLLDRAQKDSYRPCRVTAIDALMSFLSLVDNPDTMAKILPGITSSLLKIIVHTDYKMGSKIPAKAIACLCTMLQLTISDARCGALVQKPEYTLQTALHPEISMVQSVGERSKAWLEAAQSNLSIALSKICTTQRHHNKPRVREALVVLCTVIVQECRWALQSSFLIAHETLLSLCYDPVLSIQSQARDTKRSFLANMTKDERLWLHNQATVQVVEHLKILALKCSKDVDIESEACATLQLVLAYLSWSDIAIDNVLDDIVNAMVKILRIDHVDAQVLANRKESDLTIAYYRKRYVHFRNESAIRLATQFLHTIGCLGSTFLWIDHTIHLIYNQPENASELLLMIHHFTLGAAGIGVELEPKSPITQSAIGYLLDQLMQLPQWNSQLTSAVQWSGANKNLLPPTTLVNTEESTSFLLEVVGSCAQVLEVKFKLLLIHVLYPIVEHLTGQTIVVHQAASATLKRIAYYCQYKDVGELLHENMDYIIDMLCLRLNQLDAYPRTPFVVEGLLMHADASSSLALLYDAIKSVIESVDKYVSTTHSHGLLRIMKVIVSSIKFNEPPLPPPSKPTKLQAFIKEMKTLFDPNEGAPDDESSLAQLDNMLDENEQLADKMKAAMPMEFDPKAEASNGDKVIVSLTSDIILRCAYYIAAPDVATSCLAGQVLAKAFPILNLTELRPIVARIWPALVKRLSSPLKPVILASLECINSLAQLCGDFIADKFIDDAWPIFQTLLEPTDNHVARLDLTKDSSDSVPIHSLVHQIQLQALVCLTHMCKASEMFNTILLSIARTTSGFLRHSASQPLQAAARDLFVAMAHLNGDALYPMLAVMGNVALPAPPSKAFPAFTSSAVQNVQFPCTSGNHEANGIWVLSRMKELNI
ncbi:hypothetical protein THRCLA_08862 [Thraustotheca clavata]|uniref:Uncharacterized protein n=1 Tax=Thraustotheca clavata TaxID=74557 RepID=A0A1V9Z1D1_9STRA|nr:hypothetical protein THRCLA_08862 [Thraustotheca clavata]